MEGKLFNGRSGNLILPKAQFIPQAGTDGHTDTVKDRHADKDKDTDSQRYDKDRQIKTRADRDKDKVKQRLHFHTNCNIEGHMLQVGQHWFSSRHSGAWW